MKKFTKKIKQLGHHKLLILSLLINICLVAALIYHRDYFISRFFQVMYERYSQINSYHLSARLSATDTSWDLTYVKDPAQFKQLTFNWSNQDQPNSFTLIYNQDNFYFKFHSPQLKEYIDSTVGGEKGIEQALEPLTTGQTWLHLDTQALDSFNPGEQYEQDVMESNQLVASQIMSSLRLRSIPTITMIDKRPYLKLPLKLDYAKLNQILYPSVKSYLVPNQALLEEILNQATVDLYLNAELKPARIVISSPKIGEEKVEELLEKSTSNIFGQLNDHLKSAIKEQDAPYSLIIDISSYNQEVHIDEPQDSIRPQDLADLFMSTPAPKSVVKSGYTINNAFKMTSSGKEVDSNLYQISNMLYRYFNEHGKYPATLDPLAKNYFPGDVPGNPATAQGYSYQTFDNHQGYLLCPESNSAQNYCLKRFKFDLIN